MRIESKRIPPTLILAYEKGVRNALKNTKDLKDQNERIIKITYIVLPYLQNLFHFMKKPPQKIALSEKLNIVTILLTDMKEKPWLYITLLTIFYATNRLLGSFCNKISDNC